jgi:hypothetical protein
MVDNSFQRISKKSWYRWSFYINIILFFIVAVFIYLLVRDSIEIGLRWGYANDIWLYLVRDVAFLAVALALIFFQFFRNLWTIMRRSW